MAISDIAQNAAAGLIPKGACAVCKALHELPPNEATALRELLANPRVRYSELSDMLAADTDHPLELKGDWLGKHARGACAAQEKLR